MFFPHKTLRHYIKTSLDVKGYQPELFTNHGVLNLKGSGGEIIG